MLNSLTNFAVSETEVDCIIDYSHIALKGVNNFFKSHSSLKKFSLFIIGIIIDSSAVILSYNFILKGKTWKPLIISIHFLLFKILCNFVFEMSYPEDSLLEYSGIPSILISYKFNKNPFFASLTGLNIIFVSELKRNVIENKQSNFMKYFVKICYANIPFKIFVDLSIRSHYIIDELTALILAHYCIISSDEITNFFDDNFPLDSYNINEEPENKKPVELKFIEKMNCQNKDDLDLEVVDDKYFEGNNYIY